MAVELYYETSVRSGGGLLVAKLQVQNLKSIAATLGQSKFIIICTMRVLRMQFHIGLFPEETT